MAAVRAVVEIRLHGLSGRYEQVWFDGSDLETFAGQLRQIERERDGAAKLVAMSPDEFELKVEPFNSTGQCRAVVRLCVTKYVADQLAPALLSGAFEIDSEFVARLCGEVGELLEGSSLSKTEGAGSRDAS